MTTKNNRIISAVGTNSTLLKSTPGNIYGGTISNMTAGALFIKFYDKATAPTVGTDSPVMTVAIQANTTSQLIYDLGIPFANGIGVGITGAYADSDTTSAGSAGAVLANILTN